VFGLLPSLDEPQARLLVVDDRSHDVLASVLPDARAGVIEILDDAG
jgi:hypothetical protein